DVEHLEWSMLRRSRRRGEGDNLLVVTDSVFSMDGHVAPLVDIVEIAQHHGARLVVDDAHATGVLGPGGRGAVAQAGLHGEGDMPVVPLVLGDERAALSLCEEAIAGGVFAQAIRPPTVPTGTSRLRLAAMASHTPSDMRMAAAVLAEAARSLGLSPGDIGAPA